MLRLIIRGLIFGFAAEIGVTLARRHLDVLQQTPATTNTPTRRKNTGGRTRPTSSSKKAVKGKANARPRARRKTGDLGDTTGGDSTGAVQE